MDMFEACMVIFKVLEDGKITKEEWPAVKEASRAIFTGIARLYLKMVGGN